MKKFLNSLIIIFVFMFVGIVNVEAASFGVISGGNVNGKSFKVPINDAAGFVYTYDPSFLSCGGNGTSASDNPYGRLINDTNVELTCTINSSDYKVLELALVDPNNSNASVSTTYEVNTSKKTPASTQSSTTVNQTTVAKSNNANLKSLSVKTSDDRVVEITPKFDAGITEYSATVDSSVKTVNVEAIMEDSKANVVLSKNASEELNAGENNKITITVTAEDGTKRAYTLNIKREALTADATLKTLIIKEAKNFKLKTDQYSYSIKVANDVKKLSLDIETSDDTATYVIEGNEALKDGSIVKIIVTAEDGTKKVYKLNISKVSTTTKKKVVVNAEKNPLIIMGLSIIAFGLIGGIIYVIKK